MPIEPAHKGASGPGEVDYRLARKQVIAEFRRGRLGRNEVCDAHPELVRAAVNVGTPCGDTCPICEDVELVHVSYVFGPGLPAQGRCVTSPAELARLRNQRERACYVVEVCPSCHWNHLARAFPVIARRSRAT
jgi:hypothetical protein